MADTAITFQWPCEQASEQLMACAERAFHKAMPVARAGFRIF